MRLLNSGKESGGLCRGGLLCSRPQVTAQSALHEITLKRIPGKLCLPVCMFWGGATPPEEKGPNRCATHHPAGHPLRLIFLSNPPAEQ